MQRLFLVIFVIFLTSHSYSQQKNPRMSRYGFEINYKPLIYFNTFISYKEGPKLYFSLNIQNDILQFKKESNNYRAQYEITLNIKDFDEKNTLFSESWKEHVLLNEFKRTNAKQEYQNSRKTFNLNLPSGKYKLFIELSDAQTGNNYFSKRTIKVVDQKKMQIPHSSIVFLNNRLNSSDNILISSSKNVVEFKESPFIMIEYYSNNSDSMQIISELKQKSKDDKVKEVINKTYKISPKPGFNYFVENLNDSLLFEGDYILNYSLMQSQNKAVLKDTFKVIWFDKPVYLYKYDLAVRPMKYLLSPQEYEKVEDLSLDELEEWFKDYWKSKDKTPDTPYNEVQNEFYQRVQQAIDEFSLRFKEGWRTERGEALILYGKPSSIEKQHHSISSKPYEIWYYENLDKKITFLDIKENGDFKLISIESTKEN